MRSCPRQLAARLPPPRLPTSALAGPALAVLKVMKDAGQSNTPKTARWGRLSGLVDVRFGSKADIADRDEHVRFVPKADSCGAAKKVAIRLLRRLCRARLLAPDVRLPQTPAG